MNLQIQVCSKIIVQDFIREKGPTRSDSLPKETKKPRGFPKEADEDKPALLEMQHTCFITLLSLFLKVKHKICSPTSGVHFFVSYDMQNFTLKLKSFTITEGTQSFDCFHCPVAFSA